MKEYKSFYKTVGGNEGSKCIYNTRLDTYGCGCFHDCNYCYAKSLLEFRGLWNAENPSVADIKKVENKIKKIPKGTILRLGGMTDCFQPIELKHRNTYENHKCKKYFTKKENGLLQSWKNEIVFCNPPYGRELPNWVKKAYEENKINKTKIVMLIPARTDTKYFHKYIYKKAEIRFIKGRLKFGDGKGSAPFPSMLVIYN